MSTNVTGLRTHRSPQNLEMDLAWQELMAITELQVGTLLQVSKTSDCLVVECKQLYKREYKLP